MLGYPSQVSSVIRRTTSQQNGQPLVLLCYSPATNRRVKFPDWSGYRPHDTGKARMIFCGWRTQYCPSQDTIRVGGILYLVSGHTAIERIGDEIGIAFNETRIRMT